MIEAVLPMNSSFRSSYTIAHLYIICKRKEIKKKKFSLLKDHQSRHSEKKALNPILILPPEANYS